MLSGIAYSDIVGAARLALDEALLHLIAPSLKNEVFDEY
jgi:hypothetical protein